MSNNFALENNLIRFSLQPQTNQFCLEDKRAGVSWGNGAGHSWVSLLMGEKKVPLMMERVEAEDLALRAFFVDSQVNLAGLTIIFRLVEDALQVFVVANPAQGIPPKIELFTHGLQAYASEGGEALLPMRMGVLFPSAGKQPFDLHLGTYDYEGVHMAMAALFKSGAALMATWQDPYTALHLTRHLENDPHLHMGFELSKTAHSLSLHCLGKGDYHRVAEAYRPIAQDLGYRQTWSEKLKQRPQAERLFGACNFKLWTALDRRIDENLVEQSVTVHWTFDEVAQIAEHLKQDLKLDDVLFHLGGWTTYGYDCRHPDDMPANPECGGNEGLANCARRVQACGYLFCLHDNYQDMYRDSPSWDEGWIQKRADGSLTMGGVWLGGQAYYTCARQALRLAQRPQNLPLIRDTFHPDLYFIDTTYAVGPQECYDPRHPLTKQEDIHWKAELSDYARETIGMFGSECGREWAVPHADFFEGLVSVSGGYYSYLKPEELDARIVPLFDMVFHDCIVIHGKYGYEPAEMAEQVIHHAALGRTLYYHSLGDHLYWQDPATLAELPAASDAVDPALFTRAHNGWAEGYCVWDRFMKNTQEILGPLNQRTSQALIERYEFLDPERRIRQTLFSNGIKVTVNGSDHDFSVNSKNWGNTILPPFGLLVEAPDFCAFVAKSWNGATFKKPVLFTLTSLDGKDLEDSKQVRVFHGFGEEILPWQGKQVKIHKETIL